MCNLLKVENLSFKYENKKILNNFNISILDNKITILRGQNGSGKTTFLNILSGVICDENIEGDFFWKGKKTCLETVKRDIENNNYIERCKELSKIFNIFEDLEKIFSSYSSGMKQKLWLSIILSRNVSLFLLDEPFNTLDKDGIDSLIDILCSSKRTHLIVSHELPEKIYNCARIIDIK